MIVVDTNIIAYFFIAGDKTKPARDLWNVAPAWVVPPLWRHEYLNVLATFARHRGASINKIVELWYDAHRFLSKREQDVDLGAALKLAVQHEISAYDAQYIALAKTLKIPCVTEDKSLAKAFPKTALSMREFLKKNYPPA